MKPFDTESQSQILPAVDVADRRRSRGLLLLLVALAVVAAFAWANGNSTFHVQNPKAIKLQTNQQDETIPVLIPEEDDIPEEDLSPLPPTNCAAAACLKPLCPSGQLVVPPGECCPVCVPKPDCSAVSCLKPACNNAITPPGECCPQCPDCSAVACAVPQCNNPIPKAGECCPQCPDCSNVLCAAVACKNPIRPPGACCDICPPSPPVEDCTRILCPPLSCKNPIKLPNECCAVCPEDCSSKGPNVCGPEKERTCKYPNPGPSPKGKCTKGCFCRPGFVRKRGKCVPFEKCLGCKKNFKFMGCATCDATCDNPNPICPAVCQPARCVCRPPYALTKSGKCILARRCPRKKKGKKCKEEPVEEEEEDCCQKKAVECPLINCPPEFLTGYPGACCETICTKCDQPNTEFLYLGLTDVRRCGRPNPPIRNAPLKPKPGCYCKPGFVRNKKGDCVPQSTCIDFCAAGCKTFFDGCNTCQCNGKLVLCTKKACTEFGTPKCLECRDPLATFFEAGPCVSPCGSDPCVHAKPGPPGCYCSDRINMRLNKQGNCVPKQLCDDCLNVICPRLELACPNAKDQILTSPNACCPVCEKCARVDCPPAPTSCAQGVPYIPKGQCCPVCPDCSTAKCASCESRCGKGAKCAFGAGDCCGSCCNQPPDCAALKCPAQLCPDGKTAWGCTGKCFLDKDLKCQGFTPKSVCAC